jgi:DNA-cytosine methyltransferase
MVLKYISLFSGIGGFEVAILRGHPKAKCVGYSEIDPRSIKVYESNFPGHVNLGDVTRIKKARLLEAVKAAGGCDLLVAGFPCNDLSSINQRREGLEGANSGLFYDMLRILKVLVKLNPAIEIVVENNASMAEKWKGVITSELSKTLGRPVVYTTIDSGDIVLQARKRMYWTTSSIPAYKGRVQTWSQVLDPLDSESIKTDAHHHVALAARRNGLVHKKHALSVSKDAVLVKGDVYRYVDVPHGNRDTRWVTYPHHSDTDSPKARTIHTTANDSVLVDRRGCAKGAFRIRRFTVRELCRLFTFDRDHVPADMTVNSAYVLFGKAVIVKVVEHVLAHALKSYSA